MTDKNRRVLDTLILAMGSALADVHTAAVARVTGVNATTINCQPVVSRLVDGVKIDLPEFVEVPPVFLQGGGSYTAHPIAVGDYCLLLFSERCFDRWYAGDDNQTPLELRMHDYSDGFALVGVNPLAAAIAIPAVIQQTGDTNQDGAYTHQGNRTQTGDFILNGNLTVNGNITCTGTIAAGNFTGLGGGAMTSTSDIVSGSISLQNHTHTENDVGGETSTAN